jgi:hypothetical protein
MGLFDGDATCRFCRKETETVQHIICCCEALACQRYNVFGNLFVEPKEISTASVRDLCLYIKKHRAAESELNEHLRVCTISLRLRSIRGNSRRPRSLNEWMNCTFPFQIVTLKQVLCYPILLHNCIQHYRPITHYTFKHHRLLTPDLEIEICHSFYRLQ